MSNSINTQSLETTSAFSWTAACWQMLACCCFAAINGVVRYLGGGGSFSPDKPLSGDMMLFFQNIFGTLFLLPLLLKSGCSLFPKKEWTAHLLRVFSGALGTCLWYVALQKMSIATGLALTFTGPIFTIIGSKLLLKEMIGKKRACAIGLSIIGAFIICRPDRAISGDPSTLGLAALLPLGSAIAFVVSKLLTRKLASQGETPESLATYLLLLMTPISFFMTLPNWTTPTFAHLPWLILLGILSATAHFSFGKAYSKAEVTILMPFGFSKFLFSALIGYFCFFEIPSLSLIIGILIISISILLVSQRRFFKKKLLA